MATATSTKRTSNMTAPAIESNNNNEDWTYEDLQQEAEGIRKKINRFRQSLGRFFIGKQEIIDLMLVASVAQEPLLLVGVPGCLAGDTELLYQRGERIGGRAISLKEFYHKFNGIPTSTRKWEDLTIPTYLHSIASDGRVFYNPVVAVTEAGVKPVIRIDFDDGSNVRLTKDHPIATPNGEFVEAMELKVGNDVLARGSMKPTFQGGKDLKGRPPRVVINVKHHPLGAIQKVEENGIEYLYKRVPRARLVVEAVMNGVNYEEYVSCLKGDAEKSSTFKFLASEQEVHHKDENTMNDSFGNLQVLSKVEHARHHSQTGNFNVEYLKEVKVTSIKEDGEEMTYDIQMTAPANNFCANGIIVHNTAKSDLVLKFKDALGIHDDDYFEYMLTRFCEPSEIIGPIDISALREGKYIRREEGKLPTAKLAFLDEIFKANSAILNILLTIINEKKFYQDGVPQPVKLKVMFAATNEVPEQGELGALKDRFVLKIESRSVSEEHFTDLIDKGLESEVYKNLNQKPWIEGHCSLEDLLKASKYLTYTYAKKYRSGKDEDLNDRSQFFPADVFREFQRLVKTLMREDKIFISDRKLVKLYKLLRTRAWIFTGGAVTMDDLKLLSYLGETHQEIKLLREKVPNLLGN